MTHMTDLDRHRLIYQCLDLTSLSGAETPAEILKLAALATHPILGHVAAVCITPPCIRFLPQLDDIHIATVINFPRGDQSVEAVIQEIQQAISLGAQELDLVIPYQDVQSNHFATTEHLLSVIQPYVKNKTLKIIVESSALSPVLLQSLCERILSLNLKIDFLKTSTGKSPAGGVTLEAATIMLTAIKDHFEKTHQWVGFKASGGVSEITQAQALIDLAEAICGKAYLTPHTLRLGASRLAKAIIVEHS